MEVVEAGDLQLRAPAPGLIAKVGAALCLPLCGVVRWGLCEHCGLSSVAGWGQCKQWGRGCITVPSAVGLGEQSSVAAGLPLLLALWRLRWDWVGLVRPPQLLWLCTISS